ncbi:uncharacterized protein LOC132851974 [Tachysurus vachellii]|uniref:uncharacterized protein LOC132851974 n=1 Tax=Tachysurus vachellii TaxID=175792 RepID=UPI00296AEBB2|nr:uncharacterized protein LOC132851974 [Tachysurus vachellii]
MRHHETVVDRQRREKLVAHRGGETVEVHRRRRKVPKTPGHETHEEQRREVPKTPGHETREEQRCKMLMVRRWGKTVKEQWRETLEVHRRRRKTRKTPGRETREERLRRETREARWQEKVIGQQLLKTLEGWRRQVPKTPRRETLADRLRYEALEERLQRETVVMGFLVCAYTQWLCRRRVRQEQARRLAANPFRRWFSAVTLWLIYLDMMLGAVTNVIKVMRSAEVVVKWLTCFCITFEVVFLICTGFRELNMLRRCLGGRRRHNVRVFSFILCIFDFLLHVALFILVL